MSQSSIPPHLFITGVAGFVGSNLAIRALSEGWHVSGIDVVPRSDAWRLFNLEIDYTWGSLQDIDLRSRTGKIDYIVHTAAIADVPFAEKSPIYTFQQNVIGTLNLLEDCRREISKGIRRIIVQSSESVYGRSSGSEYARIDESDPLEPTNMYAASKASQEMVAIAAYHSYNLPITIVRSSTLFGPNGRRNQVIPIFLQQALLDQPITIHGDGAQSRDFNFISNLLDGLFLILKFHHQSRLDGEIFNIAGNNEVSIRDLAEKCIAVTGSNSKLKHLPQRSGEQDLRLIPDISKASEILRYEPQVTFEEGLKTTAEWLKGLPLPAK